MELFFQECFELLESLHAQISVALEGMPPDGLDWVPPAGDTNSMAVIAVHTAASERYWIGDVIAQEPSSRDREAEFRTRGLSMTEINTRLASSLKYTHGVLSRLSLADLAGQRVAPLTGKETSVGRALAHTLEHVGMHADHLQLTRQWWEQQAQP